MELKVFSLLLLSFPVIFAQNSFLQCAYIILDGIYTCDLTIQNPTGLNNFTDIRGNHRENYSDQDVMGVRSVIGVTPNFPSIVCEKFQNIRAINILAIGVQRIHDYSLRNCSLLVSFTSILNAFTEIDENAFIGNPELYELEINFSDLSTLPENVFSNNQNLNLLTLNRNYAFTTLPQNIFRPLSNLRELTLIHSILEELPRNVFAPLTNMTRLLLGHNRLNIVHSDPFGHLPGLTFISLWNNQVEAIDERLIDNTGVSTLEMPFNNCASGTFVDNTPLRINMRSALARCFENYIELMPG